MRQPSLSLWRDIFSGTLLATYIDDLLAQLDSAVSVAQPKIRVEPLTAAK